MKNVYIRKYQKKDQKSIIDICYATGYHGLPLDKTKFSDKKLFALIFALYYTIYEPNNCFVAEVDNTVVGYVIGTRDTHNYSKQFLKKMYPRILFRIITYTLWLHIRDVIRILSFSRIKVDVDPEIINKYPAHLHINVLGDYQGIGIGSKLIETFEKYINKNLHLVTSDKNDMAIPFYLKHGYIVKQKINEGLWNTHSIVFTKEIIK